MTPDQKQEMKDTVRTAAKDVAVGLVKKPLTRRIRCKKRSGSASVVLYAAA